MYLFWMVEDEPFDFLQGFMFSSAGLGSQLVSQNNFLWSVVYLVCLIDLCQNVSLYYLVHLTIRENSVPPS